MTMGERIRERRIALELSQDELAKRMGYKSRAAICKVETGEDNLAADRITKFAKALSTTEAYLMGWDDAIDNASASTAVDLMLDVGKQEYVDKLFSLSPEHYQAVCDIIDMYVAKEKSVT